MAEKLHGVRLMRRRAYLRTVTLAVPGLLLTGWAPARAAARPVHLLLHDIADGIDADALRAGVELGLEDVSQAARVLQQPLCVHRSAADAKSATACPEQAVEIVVADKDDRHVAPSTIPCGPRLYTCPLEEWRPEAWSVASRLPATNRRPSRLDWHPRLDTPGAAQLSARFLRRSGAPMGEAAWRGWMAVKAAFEIAVRAEAGEDDLLVLRLDGHKGQPLRFSEDGHLVQPTYQVLDGGAVIVAAPVDHDRLVDAN